MVYISHSSLSVQTISTVTGLVVQFGVVGVCSTDHANEVYDTTHTGALSSTSEHHVLSQAVQSPYQVHEVLHVRLLVSLPVSHNPQALLSESTSSAVQLTGVHDEIS